MYQDIYESLEKAMIVQRWNEGDKFHRIGHPFQWIDADQTPGHQRLGELSSMMPHFTMIYEKYPTPIELQTEDFDTVFSIIRTTMIEIFTQFFPFLEVDNYGEYFDATALTRAQDYAFISTFSEINLRGIKHMDVGPGLGSHSFYSRLIWDSLYCGIEAYPQTYQIQRNIFRQLGKNINPYLDFVAAENFGVSDSKLETLFSQWIKGILHVPSWKAPLIPNNYFDLVTATWVLNELNMAGIVWLLCHCVRTLRVGGLFYIRDSDKRKPGRHSINYDLLLLELGFEEVKRLQVRNRVDFYGVPRMYRKTDRIKPFTFDELIRKLVGHFDTTSNPLDSNFQI